MCFFDVEAGSAIPLSLWLLLTSGVAQEPGESAGIVLGLPGTPIGGEEGGSLICMGEN